MAMKKSPPPNWLKMPHELMVNIIQRLDSVEVLNSARKVCTTWRRVCKDPVMWKVIDISEPMPGKLTAVDLQTLTKQAVDLSCGELIDITIDEYGTDDLLDYIVQRSSKLKCLFLLNCKDITSRGVSEAVKRVPQLEELRLHSISIDAEDIGVIGRNCPHLKSFMLVKVFRRAFLKCEDHALAIAKNMPELRHLVLSDDETRNNGLKAILNGCPHLESLDVRGCSFLYLKGDFGELCKESVKDFKFLIRDRIDVFDDGCLISYDPDQFPEYYE